MAAFWNPAPCTGMRCRALTQNFPRQCRRGHADRKRIEAGDRQTAHQRLGADNLVGDQVGVITASPPANTPTARSAITSGSTCACCLSGSPSQYAIEASTYPR